MRRYQKKTFTHSHPVFVVIIHCVSKKRPTFDLL